MTGPQPDAEDMYRLPMIFPGQASQVVGMARDLASGSGPAADILSRVDGWLGAALTKLMYEGPLEVLTETHNAQPAILAHSVAVVAELREKGIVPSIVAGHSLGEFSAAVAAGALEPDDGLRLVRRRGELMFAAGQERPGTMAAVMGLDALTVRRVCGEISQQVGTVCLANHNSPAQLVISGEVTAVAAAGEALKTAGAKRVVVLQVSGAFHSPLLAMAATRFGEHLAEVPISDLQVPLVANVSARAVRNATDLRDGFTAQLTAPVLWHDSLETILNRGAADSQNGVVLEVGPGRVLSTLAKRSYPSVRFLSVGTQADLDNILDLLRDRQP